MLVTPNRMALAEKKCDEEYLCLEKLMDNAAQKLCEFIISRNICGKILFLCGKGNNGGDGIVAATKLKQKGFFVTIALVCKNVQTALAKNAIENAKNANVEIITDFNMIKSAVKNADAIIDCVFGTGFKGVLEAEIGDVFKMKTNAVKISADIPSGANGLTGFADENAFCADFTLTFGRKKVGMSMYPAKEKCGEILVCDIGIPDNCYDGDDKYFEIDLNLARKIIPKRSSNSHKGNFGKVLCIVGSKNMTGAAQLCIDAALRSGAGIVCAAVPESVKNAIACAVPEALWLELAQDSNGFITKNNINKLIDCANACDAVVIGCGLGVTEDTEYIVKTIIEKINCPIILDADGINCIAGCIDILTRKDNIVVTPHPGEASRLIKTTVSSIADNRIECARRICKTGAVCVLKGAATIVAKGGCFGINTTGNAGMSRGGSGDVLSGIIGALAAQHIDIFDAALLGVYLHSLAGDIAAQELSQYACLPRDFVRMLSKAFLQVENKA